MDVFQALGFMKVEELTEGKKRITLLKPNLLAEFTDWYNQWLFTEESKRVTIEEKQLGTVRALIFYGKKLTPDENGKVKVNLTEMQNNSMRDLNALFGVSDADPLVEKGLVEEKQSGENNNLTMVIKLRDLETVLPYWEIIYTLKRIPGRS